MEERMRIISEVPLTPKLIADAFWNLNSIEQAEFFSELHDIVLGKEWPAHSLGEMQWFYMSDEIEKNPKAKKMACALASHIFVRATDYLRRSPDDYGGLL
jgi:hypothetical protein